MATLRLFAGIREAAGTGSIELQGETVAEVIDTARDRFGTEFSAMVQLCRVWLNGEPAEPGDAVGPDDEVALLPPVSGGA